MQTARFVGASLLVLAIGCGDNGGSYFRTDINPEPAGTNCAAGGVRIDSGFDQDDSGSLEGVEIETTKYVCNGADGQDGEDGENGAGGAKVVKVFEPDGLLMSTQDAPVTLATATVAVDGPGQIVAIGSADVYCQGGPTSDCALMGEPAAAGWLWISDEDAESYANYDFDYWTTRANTTESMTRTTAFDVTAAGDVSIYLRGERNQSYGWFNFYRRGLTIVFLPE